MNTTPDTGLAALQRTGFNLQALDDSTELEMLVWHKVPGPQRPDADETVLLALDDGENWQGYWDDEAQCWCDVHGSQVGRGVVAWSSPAGPRR